MMIKNSFINTLSYWEKDIFFQPYDCIIVGGGIVGTNAAISLKEKNPNWRIAIVDKSIIPTGASSKNAGFATFGSISEILADVRNTDLSTAIGLIKKRWLGLETLINRVGAQKLDINWAEGHELFLVEDEESFEACKTFLPLLNEAIKEEVELENAFYLNDNSSKFKMNCAHVISNHFEGVLHPGRMMQALHAIARQMGVEYFGSFTVSHHENQNGIIRLLNKNGISFMTKQLLYATNGFSKLLFSDLDVHPARNQVILTEEIPNIACLGSFHYQEGYFYWRNVGNRILLGGARNLDKSGETTTELGESEVIQKALLDFLQTTILPNQKVNIEHKWSGIMGVGETKVPIIKEIQPNVFAAIRLGGMGVAIGTLVGQEAADLIDSTK